MTTNVIGGVIGAAKSLFKSQLDRIKRFVNEAARPGGRLCVTREQQLLAIQSKFTIATFIGDSVMYQQAVSAFRVWRSK